MRPPAPVVDVTEDLPRGAKSWPTRSLGEIRGIVVHHTASEHSLEQVAEFHRSQGAPGIRYTYWIDFDGAVSMCNPLIARTSAQGGGASPVPFTQPNTSFIAVVLRGDWSQRDPLPTQQIALRWLWASLAHNLVLGHDLVLAHREVRATECPGRGALVVQSIRGSRPTWMRMPHTVADFQAVLRSLGHDLKVDGILGPITRAALESSSGAATLCFESSYRLASRMEAL